ncbi:ABC transporter permease [Paraburkholderia sp. RL18-103-BIB-C]|jgi:putative xylitol transport system permease protein|uniref:ABC transporter permease n=1 Tax=unclassified Paraburkholderia TaxID=2615204 RepID=UPI0038B8E1CC
MRQDIPANKAASTALPKPISLHAVLKLANNYGIAVAFIALCIALSFSSDVFLTWGNWTNIIRQTAINGMLAIGVTFVILTRGIDLSVGAVMALAGVVGATLAVMPGEQNIVVILLAGCFVGAFLGWLNGVAVARLSLPPFVVTLGMLSVARGLTFIFTDGQPVLNLSPQLLWLGSGSVFGVPVPIVVLILLFAICWFVLQHTVFGRHIYAVGGSEKSAATSGVRVKRVITAAYVISGLTAALGGLILTARTTAALPQAGVAYELDAIAAVVIGGTSLSGGKGSLVGTLFGALIIGTINNGLDLLGVSSYYQQVIKGLIIVGAVMLDATRRGK